MTLEETAGATGREDAGATVGATIAAGETHQAPELEAPAAAKQRAERGRWARLPRRKPIKKAVILTHRWTSIVLGLVLLVITTTGAAVVYSPEWTAWSNSSVFKTTASASPVSIPRAVEVVSQAHPDFEAATVNVYKGLYEVSSSDDDKHPGFWGVDPGSGTITGYANTNRGFMAFMNQAHECFFTCKEQPGYIGFLNDKVPTLGMKWLVDITFGGFILGIIALMLLFLALSGIWLWWPGVKKWTHGFRVRWSKGRYARDYDLHQVLGMVAVPFLLIWGLTGAGFEFNWVSTAWYATTGGHTPPDEADFTSAKAAANTPDIGLAAAADKAQAVAGKARMVYAQSPDPDDQTAVYDFWFSKGFDQYRYGSYPGQYEVKVDRHNAALTKISNLGRASSLSNQIWDNLKSAMFHYGQSVNGWWRIPWFVFGLTPIMLAVTGMSTWLSKRGVRKRRRMAQAAGVVAPDVDELVTAQ